MHLPSEYQNIESKNKQSKNLEFFKNPDYYNLVLFTYIVYRIFTM